MGSPYKWIVVVLAGLGTGIAARICSDSRRFLAHTSGTEASGLLGDSSGASATTHTETGAQGDPSEEVETVESILACGGFERAERLGRFLISAQPADLERLLLGLREKDGIVEITFGDAIFLRWMTVDPAGGLVFAEKEEFTRMAWWAWGRTAPEAALAAALEKPQSWIGTMVVRAIGQSDPLLAREILDRHPQFEGSAAMDGVASGMIKIDPVAGATLAAAWNSSIDHGNLVSSWARREPEAAMTWAQALPDLTKRAEALSVVLDQWAAVHPEKVAPAIEALPEGRMKWKLYAEHAKRLAATDPEAARAWVEAASTPSLRREAAVELARGLTAANPAGALNVLRGVNWSLGDESIGRIRSIRPGGSSTSGNDPLAGVLSEISSVAPAESLDFVADLTAFPHVKQRLTQQAFQSWVSTDALAASEWLADQPAGVVRQSATEQLAIHLSRGPTPDFEAAAQWALTLPRDHGVSGVVTRVFQEWRGRDREAAQAFLDRPDCPPEVRAALAPESQTP